MKIENGILIDAFPEEIVIPKGVKVIGSYAFNDGIKFLKKSAIILDYRINTRINGSTEKSKKR